MTDIEDAAMDTVTQWELEAAQEAIREAHQNLAYFYRRRNHAEAGISNARIALREARKRLDALLGAQVPPPS